MKNVYGAFTAESQVEEDRTRDHGIAVFTDRERNTQAFVVLRVAGGKPGGLCPIALHAVIDEDGSSFGYGPYVVGDPAYGQSVSIGAGRHCRTELIVKRRLKRQRFEEELGLGDV